jgi:hypothetical protein
MNIWTAIDSSEITVFSILKNEDQWIVDIEINSTVVDYSGLETTEFDNGSKIEVTSLDNKSFDRSCTMTLELLGDDIHFVRRALNLMRDQLDSELQG